MIKNIILYILVLSLLIGTQTGCRKSGMAQKDKDLLDAIRSGNTTEVVRLLKDGANIRIKDQHGNTPLHIAAMNGHIEAAKLLIEKGVDVNARDDSNDTPLHSAVMLNNMASFATAKDRLEFVEWFLANGADVTARNNHQSTPLHNAVGWGWFKQPPLENPEYKDTYKAIIQALLEKGADPNAEDRYGRTPLTLAEGEPEIIELLLKHGAVK